MTIYNKILRILENRPYKYFSSFRIGKSLKIDSREISKVITKLIKEKKVMHKFIFNPRKNLCLRLIKHKERENHDHKIQNNEK